MDNHRNNQYERDENCRDDADREVNPPIYCKLDAPMLIEALQYLLGLLERLEPYCDARDAYAEKDQYYKYGKYDKW